ncbi:MAG: hypothetical protein WDZ45_03575 [Flavobacteriaceae bacterium]
MSSTTFNEYESFKKNSILKPNRLLILVFFAILSSTVLVNAQDREGTEIYSLEQLTSNTSLKSELPDNIKPETIIPLITDLQSTVYINNGIMKVRGENPVRVYLDLNSLSKPLTKNTKFDNVELVKIYIENERDLFSKINLDNLSVFTKLKYIHIVCRVDCSKDQVSSALISETNKYVVIYSVEKQS